MTLNILFLTITIKKRKADVDAVFHQQEIQKLYEENKDRQITMYRFF